MELSVGQISAAAAPGGGVRRPSGSGSAQPSLQAQAIYLQRAGCSGTRGGVDTPLSGVQQRMLQRSGLGWGRGGGEEIFLLEVGGTLVSDISLAPSEWTSGARIKTAQYCSCQRKGLTWHPLPGCPENDPHPEVCSPEVATHWKCLVTHTVKQRQMATPVVLSWGSLSTPLSLCWGPLNLGTPLCC